MRVNPNQPQTYDAVLGGQHPAPMGAMVLGGLEGVKRRLASPVVEHRIAALAETLKYGVDGLDLAIACLQDRSCKVRHAAYLLLEKRTETRVQHALRFYNSHTHRVNRVVDREIPVNVSHIDTMMHNLETDDSGETSDRIDPSLSLMATPQGQHRLQHYLFNGTEKQRQYAADYFQKKGKKDIIAEAQRRRFLEKHPPLSS